MNAHFNWGKDVGKEILGPLLTDNLWLNIDLLPGKLDKYRALIQERGLKAPTRQRTSGSGEG